MGSQHKITVQEKIVDVLNKDINVDHLIVKPSSDFFKAIDEVHRLQNLRNGLPDAALPDAVNQIYDPKRKEFEMINNLEKK